MIPIFSVTGSCSVRKERRFALAFFWISGLFGGFLCFLSAAHPTASVMRGYFDFPVSIVRLLALNLLPCVISAAAASLSAFWLLILLCFLRGFLFSFVSMCFAFVFGSAGWLIWLLAMMPDLLILPFLYFFWLRSLHSGSACLGPLILLFMSTILMCSLDYWVISPFLASLLVHFPG